MYLRPRANLSDPLRGQFCNLSRALDAKPQSQIWFGGHLSLFTKMGYFDLERIANAEGDGEGEGEC